MHAWMCVCMYVCMCVCVWVFLCLHACKHAHAIHLLIPILNPKPLNPNLLNLKPGFRPLHGQRAEPCDPNQSSPQKQRQFE